MLLIYLTTGLQISWIFLWLFILYNVRLSIIQLIILFVSFILLDFIDITKFGMNTIILSTTLLVQGIMNYYIDTPRKQNILLRILFILGISISASIIVNFI